MGIVMSNERPPRDKKASRNQPGNAQFADNVRPLHRDKPPLQGRKPLPRDGKLPSVSRHQEAAGLQADDTPRQETNDVLVLLEENARLRKLAVRLSNILGDLPARDA